MKDNFKIFDEEVEETAEEVKTVVDEYKYFVAGAIIFVAGYFVGKNVGIKQSNRTNRKMLEDAKKLARLEYADELLKEAMRASVSNLGA